MSTYTLQRQLTAEGVLVTANCLHPGVVHTKLYRNLSQPMHAIFSFLGEHLFKVGHSMLSSWKKGTGEEVDVRNAFQNGLCEILCRLAKYFRWFRGRHCFGIATTIYLVYTVKLPNLGIICTLCHMFSKNLCRLFWHLALQLHRHAKGRVIQKWLHSHTIFMTQPEWDKDILQTVHLFHLILMFFYHKIFW